MLVLRCGPRSTTVRLVGLAWGPVDPRRHQLGLVGGLGGGTAGGFSGFGHLLDGQREAIDGGLGDERVAEEVPTTRARVGVGGEALTDKRHSVVRSQGAG